MTKTNFKPIYAEGNREARIIYMPGGTWQLQTYAELSKTADRSRKQPWHTLNTSMSYDDAIVRLAGYAKGRTSA